jgi:fido (protein-threonine AMPylation protein)
MTPYESNFSDAWEWWKHLPQDEILVPNLDLSLLELHRRCFRGDVDAKPGQLKQVPNYIQLSSNPAQYLWLTAPENVRSEFQALADEMRIWKSSLGDLSRDPATDLEAVERAKFIANFHACLIHIHPFRDGNGRTSRRIAYGQTMVLFPGKKIDPPEDKAKNDGDISYNGHTRRQYLDAMRAAHDNLFYLVRYFLPGDQVTPPFPITPRFRIARVIRNVPPTSSNYLSF